MRVLADARMEMRLSALDKQVLTQAATLLDTNATAFVLQTALTEARRVLDSLHQVPLGRQDFQDFAAALVRPAPAVPALRRARARLARTRTLAGFPVEPLDARHHRLDGFDAGQPVASEFLHRRAATLARQGLSRTFVLPASTLHPQVLAYYTLAPASVLPAPGGTRRRGAEPAGVMPIPVQRMPCFAVAATVQGHGFGEMLLADAVERAGAAGPGAAPGALVVSAPGAAAAAWYARFGFKAPGPAGDTMYLALPTDP